MVPSPPATRMRFVPWPIAASSRFSMSAGSTTSRSKPVFSASRAASAFPHLELRNALRAGGERREAGGDKARGERRREARGGERRETDQSDGLLYKKDADP